MRLSRTRLLLPSVLLALILPAKGGEGPLEDLDRTVRELESTVRALHAERLATASDVARAREDAARMDAEAADLEQQERALEDEDAAAAEAVRSTEKERDAAREKLARLGATADSIAAVLSASGERLSRSTLPDRLAELLGRLSARAEEARSAEVESTGAVRLGSLARFAQGSEEARRLASQEGHEGREGNDASGPVLAPLTLGEARHE